MLQQVVTQVLAQIQVKLVPPSPYEKIQCLMESCRYASRYITKGQIYASRSPDLQFKVSNVELSQGWVTVPVDSKNSGPKKKARSQKTNAKTTAVRIKKT